MKTNICIITNYAYRLFNSKSRIVFGGIETFFYLIAKDLTADNRYKVSFLLEDDVHKNPSTENKDIILFKTSREKLQPDFQDKQIRRYHRWFIFLAEKFNRLWQLPHLDFFRLWENLKQIQADVYIYASPGYESGLITLISKILKKKSIYLVVNDELLTKNYQRTKNFRDKIYYFCLKHADIIWCFSSRHQKILKHKYKINAVNLPPWYPRPKNIFPRRKRQYLLWVGRAESRKQPESFLELAKNQPHLKFLMIISPSPQEPNLFKNIIKSATKLPNLKLKQNIIFADLNQYYQRALAFIDTSNYKNLNMTQVQAAYFKTPCLTLFADPNDSFKNYHWGLTAEGDIKKMIKHISLVLDQPKLWEKMSQNGYHFADTVYNQKTNLAAFKKLIHKLTYN